MSEKQNIEILNLGGLQCDNCDWSDETILIENYNEWLNKPCPECGANVLTEEDYKNSQTILQAINIVNSMSEQDLNNLCENVDLNELKQSPIFKNAIGLDNLEEDNVQVTVSSHKEIKIDEIKKLDDIV